MFSGCYTALVTPFQEDGHVDWHGIDLLLEFQVQQGVNGILAVGTTGESPTLTWEEHEGIINLVCNATADHCLAIAGTGSNSTRETLKATAHAAHCGAKAVLLVDPYYNGPSSLEIRREYVAPVAKAFPDIAIIPYVIPGRTGTQLLPVDIALLHNEYPNVCAVKEATGDTLNMVKTRALCGEEFGILSGDDDKTWEMMWNSCIKASGVISVISNVAPHAVQCLTQAILGRNSDEALRLENALKPLFKIVTVITTEQTPHGPVQCKARNPLAIKTLMNILGMPSGPCRPPLGKMTRQGFEKVLKVARDEDLRSTEIFGPIGEFFKINITKRLWDKNCWSHLCYDSY